MERGTAGADVNSSTLPTARTRTVKNSEHADPSNQVSQALQKVEGEWSECARGASDTAGSSDPATKQSRLVLQLPMWK